MPVSLALGAQQPDTPAESVACTRAHSEQPSVQQTFVLHNATQVNDANEILTALRTMLCPSTRLFLVGSQNAIVVNAPADEIQMARKLINELDRLHRAFRLTVTLTTVDNGQRTGTEHFTIVLLSGQRTVLKQGSKIPVVTGSTKPDQNGVTSMFQYLDIGMNFDFTVDDLGTVLRLRSKIEQSSIAPEQSGVGASDPVIRQAVLEGGSLIVPGKPMLVGSFDIPGSTRRLDITIAIEPL